MESVCINAPMLLQRCVKCDEEFLPCELVCIDGCFVCEDCLHDFCEEEFVIKNHLEDFLKANEKKFLTHWFSGGEPGDTSFLGGNCWITDEEEKLAILWEAYQRWKPWHMKTAQDVERDFMDVIPGWWEDFLKEECS